MKKRMNSKAQDLSIGTLILIVLGIIILVLLILGFSMGWSNLWAKINIFGGGGKSDISAVVTACNLAVTSNSVYDYCNDFKEVSIDGKKEWVNCEDPRVAVGVETKLSCEAGKDRVAEKCLSLMIGKKAKQETKINGQSCFNVYSCGELSDKTSYETGPGAGAGDVAGVIKLTAEDGVKIESDQNCFLVRE